MGGGAELLKSFSNAEGEVQKVLGYFFMGKLEVVAIL